MVLKGPRQGIELKLFDLTQKILSENNLDLYEMEWNSSSGNLVVYIQNPKTNSAVLEDCVKVDRGFTPYMETETWIPDNFTLEVSSPGLYRVLTSVKHFKNVEGQDIMLHLIKKIDEEKYPNFPKVLRNNLKLKLLLVKASETGLLVDAKGILMEIPYDQIKRANLETDINKVQEMNMDASADSVAEVEVDELEELE
jgi:ribosome maturation factor RimP